MVPSLSSAAVSAIAFAAAVSAHGHVQTVIADGQTYTGGIPSGAPADAVGWAASNQDNGFVEPNSFGSADIACHKSATAPSNSVTVSAGSTITLQWNTWPESHKGPVIDYLASCGGDCASASAGSLSFAKIAEKGLNSGSNPGNWASDDLIANGNAWTVDIPSNLAPGGYVLRHEIIALHSAGQPNGAQSYPQCINLEVTGGGSATPSGTPATSLYTASDPGITFNLYEDFSSYPIPGPPVWSA
jgi:cellulase